MKSFLTALALGAFTVPVHAQSVGFAVSKAQIEDYAHWCQTAGCMKERIARGIPNAKLPRALQAGLETYGYSVADRKRYLRFGFGSENTPTAKCFLIVAAGAPDLERMADKAHIAGLFTNLPDNPYTLICQ